MTDRVLLTRADVADYLATTERHVRHLVQQGDLPAVYLGGKIRIRADDLLTYVTQLPPRSTPATTHENSDDPGSPTHLTRQRPFPAQRGRSHATTSPGRSRDRSELGAVDSEQAPS